MNTIGIHAGVWGGDWTPASARHAISSTRKAGFDLIEIPALDPSTVDVELTRTLLEEYGLQAGYSLGLSDNADISSEDAEIAARGEKVLEGALALTRDTGASYLGGVLFSKLGKYHRPPTQRGRENIVAALSRIAEKAQASDITLGLEFVNRYESNVLNSAQQTVEMIKEIGAPNVVVHVDTYHANIEEPSITNPVHVAGDLLGYVHLGENHRGYLGQGSVDFPAFFSALNEVGYTGTITFESFSNRILAANLVDLVGIWRNLWDDADDVATHAYKFITEGLHTAQQPRPA